VYTCYYNIRCTQSNSEHNIKHEKFILLKKVNKHGDNNNDSNNNVRDCRDCHALPLSTTRIDDKPKVRLTRHAVPL